HRITLGFVLNQERNWYDLEFAVEENGQERVPLALTGARPHLLINYQTVFPNTGETRIQLNNGQNRPAEGSSAVTGQDSAAPQLSLQSAAIDDGSGALDNTPVVAVEPPDDAVQPVVAAVPPDDAAQPVVAAEPPDDAAQPVVAAEPPDDAAQPVVAAEPPDDAALPVVATEPPDDTAQPVVAAEIPDDAALSVVAAEPPADTAQPVPTQNPMIVIGQSGNEEPQRSPDIPGESPVPPLLSPVRELIPDGDNTVKVVLIMTGSGSPGISRTPVVNTSGLNSAAGEGARASGTFYTVQVGAFREQKNAAAAYAALERGGFNPLYEYHQNLTRVVIPAVDQRELVQTREKIRALGFGDPYVRQ
ncbi:MAG: SPOR domain-containing protein, partial [Treponema sp.]|nr:SPOR domain-containing protein [Treponema sp.]